MGFFCNSSIETLQQRPDYETNLCQFVLKTDTLLIRISTLGHFFSVYALVLEEQKHGFFLFFLFLQISKYNFFAHASVFHDPCPASNVFGGHPPLQSACKIDMDVTQRFRVKQDVLLQNVKPF